MKERIQVSLNPELVEEAKLLLKARKFDSLSEYLEALIRAEWESKGKTIAEATGAPIVATPQIDFRLNEGTDAPAPERLMPSNYKKHRKRK